MSKRLFLEGFIVKPVVYALDLEVGGLERKDHGEQLIPANDFESWIADVWPTVWQNIQDGYAAEQQDTAPRAARRASTKSAKKKTPTVVPITQ